MRSTAEVRRAERRVVDDTALNKEYLPIEGDSRFRELTVAFAFGDCAPMAEGRVPAPKMVGTEW